MNKAVFRIFTGLVGLSMIAAWGRAEAPAPASTEKTLVAVVRLVDSIDDYSRDQFIKHMKQAKATGAKVIVIDLNTNGGLVTSALDISRFIRSQTDVRTVAYVSEKAYSAGAMIAVACNEIVMAYHGMLGDCAPIAVHNGKIETLGPDERAKIASPILADFRDSAARNGYSLRLVEAMVDAKVVVHWLRKDGANLFVGPEDLETRKQEGWAEVADPGVPVPLDADNTLLTIPGERALKLGLVKEIHPSLEMLVAARNYEVVATFSPSVGDKLIVFLIHPVTRLFLMVLLGLSVYLVMHAPGHGLAEAMAMLLLAVLVGVPLMTGHAQWWEIILILVGIGLLGLELFVIPGFGITGIAGILCIVIGLVLTFVGSEPGGGVMPTLPGTWTALKMGLTSVVGAMVGTLILAIWLRRYLPRVPYFGKLILTTVAGDMDHPAAAGSPADAGVFWPAVGAFGEAVSDLRPGGSVAFYDATIADVRVMAVISATGFVHRGGRIVVIDNKDNRLLVREQDSGPA